MPNNFQAGQSVEVKFPEDLWVPGTYIGEACGYPNEDFERFTVSVNHPKLGQFTVDGAHPECVRAIEHQSNLNF